VLLPNVRGIKSGSLLDQSFRFSLTLKGLHALLEMILGIAILEVNPQAMDRLVFTVLHPELSEDPGDFVATHLLRASQQFTSLIQSINTTSKVPTSGPFLESNFEVLAKQPCDCPHSRTPLDQHGYPDNYPPGPKPLANRGIWLVRHQLSGLQIHGN
jgi:predicted membrane protein DUF2127